MFARSIVHAAAQSNGVDMYMTPAGEVSAGDVHSDLVWMVDARPISSLRFAVACAYATPDAGPYGEIEVAIDEAAKQACGGHRLYNPDRFVKAAWFPWEGEIDDAIGGVYFRISEHRANRKPV